MKKINWWNPVAIVAVAMMFSPSTQAIEWTGTTGNFNTPANWQGNSVPGPGDQALINNGGTAQYSGGDVEVQSLVAGVAGGSGNYQQTDGVFRANGAFIGDTSTGTARITKGEFVIGGDSIHVGFSPGGNGTLTMDGTTVLVTSGDDIQFGREGTGRFIFNAGQIRGGYTVVGKFGTGQWDQTGGLFDQDFGDFEIGDGGRDDQADQPGPRLGNVNLSGGFIQTADSISIGNRRGSGHVKISGGAYLGTGRDNNSIFVGRGQQSSPGSGGDTSLHIVGGQAIVVATGNLNMNVDDVSQSSTLIEEITGSSHTTIKIGGDANIANGTLKVVLNGYSPKPNDAWTLIEAGADLGPSIAAADAMIDTAGYDALAHFEPAALGQVNGTFKAVDLTGATLPAGMQWKVSYSANRVVLSVEGGLAGDFNANGSLDVADIDALTVAARTGTGDKKFDVNGDNLVNGDDRDVWVNSLRKTYYGDSNLDGEFSSSDFVFVFTAGQYEDEVAGNSTWGTGDWNGDGDFNSGDFVTAFTAGGFELGPRAAVAAVPEPALGTLFALGLLAVVRRRVR